MPCHFHHSISSTSPQSHDRFLVGTLQAKRHWKMLRQLTTVTAHYAHCFYSETHHLTNRSNNSSNSNHNKKSQQMTPIPFLLCAPLFDPFTPYLHHCASHYLTMITADSILCYPNEQNRSC